MYKPKVFISATSIGLGKWREYISNILLAHGITPEEQGASVASPQALVQQIVDKINNADGVICLVGPFYGQPALPGDYSEKSITQFEWQKAQEYNRRCLTFIIDDSFFAEEPNLLREEEGEANQRTFIEQIIANELSSGRGYRRVGSPLELALELAKVNWHRWLGTGEEW